VVCTWRSSALGASSFSVSRAFSVSAWTVERSCRVSDTATFSSDFTEASEEAVTDSRDFTASLEAAVTDSSDFTASLEAAVTAAVAAAVTESSDFAASLEAAVTAAVAAAVAEATSLEAAVTEAVTEAVAEATSLEAAVTAAVAAAVRAAASREAAVTELRNNEIQGRQNARSAEGDWGRAPAAAAPAAAKGSGDFSIKEAGTTTADKSTEIALTGVSVEKQTQDIYL